MSEEFGTALNEQQQILADTLGSWFSARYPFSARDGSMLGEPWQFLTRQMGLLDPAGIGAVTEMAAMEAAGRALLAQPLGEALVAGALLRAAGGPAAAVLLGTMNAGEGCTVLAWSEAGMRDDFADIALTARRDGDHWMLDGAKAMVVGAPLCGHVIVAARTGGLSLFALPLDTPGVTVHAYRTIDGRSAGDIVLDSVRLPETSLLGEVDAALPLLDAARDHGTALQVAEAAGLLAEMLRQTVAYTSQRQQFGQAIAGFQALQHTMVDMYLEAELTAAAAWLAALALDEAPAERAHACSAAQVTAARACRLIGQKSIQLHGGMGMTDELPLGHYARRALMIEAAWGDADWHLARMAGV